MTKTSVKFVIETPAGLVAGFLRDLDMVQVADPGSGHERKFATRAAAQRFIDNYADLGYGLVTATAQIVEAR